VTDMNAAACRRLWASVLLTTLDDWNRAHVIARRRNGNPRRVDADARAWLRGSWGRTVANLAGIEPREDTVLALIRLPRAEFKNRTHAIGNRGDKEAA